jgi:hypothetical protein
VVEVHWKEEINTDEFKAFLKSAVAANLGQVEKIDQGVEALMPWKVLGRTWHLSRK